jgi:hypothetical protein
MINLRLRFSRRQKGISLVEATIGLLILGGGMTQIWSLVAGAQQQATERNTQIQMAVIGKAAKLYLESQRTSLLTELPDFTTIARIPILDGETGTGALLSLEEAGFLPPNSTLTNISPYGQTYELYAKREDAGPVGIEAAGDMVIALLVTTGGETLSDKQGARMAGQLGASGGFIYSSSNTTASGAYGAWQVSLTDWGITPGAGHLAFFPKLIGGGAGVGAGGGAVDFDGLDDAATAYGNASMYLGDDDANTGFITSSYDTTIIGSGAAISSATTDGSTILGAGAANYSPAGSTSNNYNTVVGANAMRGTLSAPTYTSENTIIGANAVGAINSASSIRGTTIIGSNAGYAFESGDYLLAIGYNVASAVNLAGMRSRSTANTIAIGSNAMQYPFRYDTAPILIGYAAGNNIGQILGGSIAGGGPIYIGSSAGAFKGSNPNSVAIGFKAMEGTSGVSTTGRNTAIGWQAMRTMGNVFQNTAIGANAMYGNINGSNNTAIGYNSMRHIDGYNNTAIGSEALTSTAYTSGVNNNTAIGYNAMAQITGAVDSNTAVGYYSLYQAGASANYNTAFGYETLYQATGSHNTAVGYQSMRYPGSGNYNTAVGTEALKLGATNTCATGNTAIGDSALMSVTCTTSAGSEGSYNTAIGYAALGSLTTGIDNTALGYRAGNPDSGGAGVAVTTGSGNIIIGNNIGLDSSSRSNYLNIGGTIRGDLANRKIVIGGNGTELASATHDLSVRGSVESTSYVSTSDRRMKTNITKLNDAETYQLFMKLQPVHFVWKASNKPAIGFIAQDVQKLFPELTQGDNGRLGINYCGLVTPAISAIKAQFADYKAMKAEQKAWAAKLDQLEHKISNIRTDSLSDPNTVLRQQKAAELLSQIEALRAKKAQQN